MEIPFRFGSAGYHFYFRDARPERPGFVDGVPFRDCIRIPGPSVVVLRSRIRCAITDIDLFS